MAEKKTIKPDTVAVVVVCEFIDKTDNTYRKAGEKFNTIQKRAKELVSLGFVKMV
jgi:hypothetical protein